MSHETQTGRMHALDGLRAVMMLLGLVIHTVITYTVGEYEAWPYNDPLTTLFADVTLAYIHAFRMPIFFVIAGLFSAMLYTRRGARGLLSNRFQRIGIPFAIGLLILWPLTISGFSLANTASGTSLQEGLAAAGNLLSNGLAYIPQATIHLWFLYYLLYFYVVAVLLGVLVMRLPAGWREAVQSAFRWLVSHRLLRIIIPAAVTAAWLYPMGGFLHTAGSFVPHVAVFGAYFLFFGFGWLLFFARDMLSDFTRHAWTLSIAGSLVFISYVLFLAPVVTESNSIDPALMRSVVGGLVVWMLFYGFTGLFIRYLDRPSARIRYIVDASYWVYLVHLPFMIWLPGLLVNTDLSVWLRMLIVLSVTTVVTFGSYDLFARSTFIGRVLNGRRYPRGLPEKHESSTASQPQVA